MPRLKKSALFLALLLLPPLTQAPARAGAACERIITLGAPAAELVYALGLGEKIIARGKLDLWPPALASLPQVGPPGQINLELILSLKPDLVAADASYSRLAERLRAYGIRTITFSAYNTQDVLPALRFLSRELEQEERGRSLAARLEALPELVAERLRLTAPERRPQALALTGTGPYYSFSDKSGWHFLNLAGALNPCADLAGPYPVLSPEWLAASRADFALVSPYRTDYAEAEREAALEAGLRSLSSAGPVSRLQATRRGQLLLLDDLLTFGPRSLIGVIYAAKKFHPALFADLDPEALHADILREYYKVPATGGHIYPPFADTRPKPLFVPGPGAGR